MALTNEKLKQLKKISDKLKKEKINSNSFHKRFAEETNLNKKETIFTSGNIYKTKDGKPIRGEFVVKKKDSWNPSIRPSISSNKKTAKSLKLVPVKEKLKQSSKKREGWASAGFGIFNPPTDEGGSGGPT